MIILSNRKKCELDKLLFLSGNICLGLREREKPIVRNRSNSQNFQFFRINAYEDNHLIVNFLLPKKSSQVSSNPKKLYNLIGKPF